MRHTEDRTSPQTCLHTALWIVPILLILLVEGVFLIQNNYTFLNSPDNIGYHNLAVNIAEHGSMSKGIYPDQTPYFFREPGNVAVFAVVYKVYSLFGKLEYYTEDDIPLFIMGEKHPPKVLYFLGYFQLLLLMVMLWVFYRTLRLFFSPTFSRLVILATVLFYPFIFYFMKALREGVLTSWIILATYYSARYYCERKVRYLLLAASFVGLSMLTFQLMFILIPALLLLVLLVERNILRALGRGLFTLGIIIAVITPWLIRVYCFFPDIRIVKTLGNSLTYEEIYMAKWARVAATRGVMSDAELEDLLQTKWYRVDSHTQFTWSYDGTYRHMGDSLRALAQQRPAPVVNKWKSKAKAIYTALGNNDWRPIYGFKDSIREQDYVALAINAAGVLFAVFAIIGLILIPKPLLIPFTLQIWLMLLGYRYCGESRRGLIFRPLMLMLMVYAIVVIVQRIGLFRNFTILNDSPRIHRAYRHRS
jgi:hypothetical protein